MVSMSISEVLTHAIWRIFLYEGSQQGRAGGGLWRMIMMHKVG